MGCCETKPSWKEQDLKLARDCINCGNFEYQQKQYINALHHYETALSIEKKYFKTNEVFLAKSFQHIGNVYQGLQSYEQAIKFYGQALQTYQKSLQINSNHALETIKVCQNLVYLYEHQQKYLEAIEYNRKALNLVLMYLKRNNPIYASIHYNMGLIYIKMQLYEEAIEYLVTYIHIMKEQSHSENGPSLFKCCYYIGQIYKTQRKFQKAAIYYRLCLDHSISHFGNNHLQVAIAYNNLALVYKDLQEFDIAFDCMMNCLKIELKHLKRHDSRVELTIQSLSYLCKFYEEGSSDFYQILTLQKEMCASQKLESNCPTEIIENTREQSIKTDEVENDSTILSSTELTALWKMSKDSSDFLDCSFFSSCGLSLIE